MAATMANSSNPTSTMMSGGESNSNSIPVRKFSGGDESSVGGKSGNGTVAPAAASGGRAAGGSAMSISSKPTLLTTQNLRFLIMDAPRQANLHLYIKECRRNHVTDIVRVCEPTYNGTELTSAGIQLHEMAYDDGHSPPEPVLNDWLTLVEDRFFSPGASPSKQRVEQKTIAVHCVAGLGRAPVLVAIALMEFEKMDAVEAVMMIRRQRRGAINENQLKYLEGYRCRRRGAGGGCACVIL